MSQDVVRVRPIVTGETKQPARYIIDYGAGKRATLELPVTIPKGVDGAQMDLDTFHRSYLDEFVKALGGALKAGSIQLLRASSE